MSCNNLEYDNVVPKSVVLVINRVLYPSDFSVNFCNIKQITNIYIDSTYASKYLTNTQYLHIKMLNHVQFSLHSKLNKILSLAPRNISCVI